MHNDTDFDREEDFKGMIDDIQTSLGHFDEAYLKMLERPIFDSAADLLYDKIEHLHIEMLDYIQKKDTMDVNEVIRELHQRIHQIWEGIPETVRKMFENPEEYDAEIQNVFSKLQQRASDLIQKYLHHVVQLQGHWFSHYLQGWRRELFFVNKKNEALPPPCFFVALTHARTIQFFESKLQGRFSNKEMYLFSVVVWFWLLEIHTKMLPHNIPYAILDPVDKDLYRKKRIASYVYCHQLMQKYRKDNSSNPEFTFKEQFATMVLTLLSTFFTERFGLCRWKRLPLDAIVQYLEDMLNVKGTLELSHVLKLLVTVIENLLKTQVNKISFTSASNKIATSEATIDMTDLASDMATLALSDTELDDLETNGGPKWKEVNDILSKRFIESCYEVHMPSTGTPVIGPSVSGSVTGGPPSVHVTGGPSATGGPTSGSATGGPTSGSATGGPTSTGGPSKSTVKSFMHLFNKSKSP
jgi:hypothetical protein